MFIGHRTRIKMENENVFIDLEDAKQFEKLHEELEAMGNFFKPEVDKPYKIELTSSRVQPVEKEFKDGTVTKYALNIKASGKEGVVFEGIWEVGASVLKPILKSYEKGAVYRITRTGSGLETRYSVVVDF